MVAVIDYAVVTGPYMIGRVIVAMIDYSVVMCVQLVIVGTIELSFL